jgi:hypothetical protein
MTEKSHIHMTKGTTCDLRIASPCGPCHSPQSNSILRGLPGSCRLNLEWVLTLILSVRDNNDWTTVKVCLLAR